jgi:hypothetical protein
VSAQLTDWDIVIVSKTKTHLKHNAVNYSRLLNSQVFDVRVHHQSI